MFSDRRDAGVQLTSRLKGYKDQPGVLVLALPRGGVETGATIKAAITTLREEKLKKLILMCSST